MILTGSLMTAASLWQMTGFSLYMGSEPILFAGFAQGFGLGCTFVPLNLLALSGLPHHILTQGTALRALMRMLGGSIGIAILETELSQNTQIVHSRLMEHLRPDNPLAQAPYPFGPIQPDRPLRNRRAQSRSHPPSGDDRLQRRFRPDADRHPRLFAIAAVGPHPTSPATARGRRRLARADRPLAKRPKICTEATIAQPASKGRTRLNSDTQGLGLEWPFL
jgi:hypothetical protein